MQWGDDSGIDAMVERQTMAMTSILRPWTLTPWMVEVTQEHIGLPPRQQTRAHIRQSIEDRTATAPIAADDGKLEGKAHPS